MLMMLLTMMMLLMTVQQILAIANQTNGAVHVVDVMFGCVGGSFSCRRRWIEE